MNVSYEGIGYLAVTLPNSSGEAGKLCKVSQSGMVVSCSTGDAFCGMVEAVDNNVAAMQIQGFVRVSVTGEIPLCGYMKLSSDGKGGVQVDNAGKEYLVVAAEPKKSAIILKL